MKYVGIIQDNSHLECLDETTTIQYFSVKDYYKDVWLPYVELDLFYEDEAAIKLCKRNEIVEILDKYNFQASTHRDAELFLFDLVMALKTISNMMVSGKIMLSIDNMAPTRFTMDDLRISIDAESIARRRNLKKPFEINF